MAMDQYDYEWRCGCGHTNPDFDDGCSGCGESRFPDEGESDREGRAEAEAADALDLMGDEPMTAYEEQREAMIDAARSAYYGDLGVETI